MKFDLTRHHLVPQHWKHIEGTNNKDNIKMLRENVHRSFHTVFQNSDPVEQLWDLTFKMNFTCLTDEFKDDVKRLLSQEDYWYYYKNWVYRPKFGEDTENNKT